MKIDFSRIPILLVFISALMGTFKARLLLPYEILILLILWLNIFVDIYATTLSMKEQNNSALYNFLTPLELLLTLIIYSFYLPNGMTKKALWNSVMFFAVFSIFNLKNIQNFFSEFASYTFFLGGFLVSLFSYLLWRHEVENGILSSSKVILWFAAANFLYYTVAVPVMSANQWLVQNLQNIQFPVHEINLVVYGIWAIIIGLGFLWKRKQTI